MTGLHFFNSPGQVSLLWMLDDEDEIRNDWEAPFDLTLVCGSGLIICHGRELRAGSILDLVSPCRPFTLQGRADGSVLLGLVSGDVFRSWLEEPALGFSDHAGSCFSTLGPNLTKYPIQVSRFDLKSLARRAVDENTSYLSLGGPQ